jgi:hypothetical protein
MLSRHPCAIAGIGVTILRSNIRNATTIGGGISRENAQLFVHYRAFVQSMQ